MIGRECESQKRLPAVPLSEVKMLYVIRLASGKFLSWTRTLAFTESAHVSGARKFMGEGQARRYAMDMRLTGFTIEAHEAISCQK